MKNWVKRNIFYITGAVLGALAGYFYWQEVGCLSGTCAITSNPVNSTIYGAAMGALLAGMFKKKSIKQVLQEEKKS